MVDWVAHVRSVLADQHDRHINDTENSLTRNISSSVRLINLMREYPERVDAADILSWETEHASMVEAQRLLREYREEQHRLSSAAPENFPVGATVEVIRFVRCGEEDIKVGTRGSVTRLDAYPWPTPPEGKTAVTFDSTIFGFIPDPDDEDTLTCCFYIPNHSLRLVD